MQAFHRPQFQKCSGVACPPDTVPRIVSSLLQVGPRNFFYSALWKDTVLVNWTLAKTSRSTVLNVRKLYLYFTTICLMRAHLRLLVRSSIKRKHFSQHTIFFPLVISSNVYLKVLMLGLRKTGHFVILLMFKISWGKFELSGTYFIPCFIIEA